MSTTYTPNLQFPLPAFGDRSWHVPLLAWAAKLDGLAGLGPLAVRPTLLDALGNPAGLGVSVAAGAFLKADGTVGTAAAQALTLAGSSTLDLWLTEAGVFTAGSAWPATNHVRLAVAVTGTALLTALTDARLVAQAAAPTPAFLAVAGGALSDGANVALGTTTGTQIGTAAARARGLRRAPVVQPAGAAQGALTDSTGGDTTAFTLAALAGASTLTDSTGGTVSTTLAAISDAATKNAIASLAAVVNAHTVWQASSNANTARLAKLLGAVRSALVALGAIKGSA